MLALWPFEAQRCLMVLQEVRVQRVAQKVHEGLQLQYEVSRPSAEGPTKGWQSDLGRLSGGERTLVSLALILAVQFASLFVSCLCCRGRRRAHSCLICSDPGGATSFPVCFLSLVLCTIEAWPAPL